MSLVLVFVNFVNTISVRRECCTCYVLCLYSYTCSELLKSCPPYFNTKKNKTRNWKPKRTKIENELTIKKTTNE